MNDSIQEQQLAASWETNAAAWATVIGQEQIESRRVATNAAIIAAVSALQPKRVLDLGCGEGWLTRALNQAGFATVGVDGSAALIAAAQTMSDAPFRVLAYDMIVADPSRLDCPYDAIVCNFSLLGAHLEPLLRALCSALSGGGALVIQTVHPWTAGGNGPYRDGWRTETFDTFGTAFAAPMPWYFRTVSSWITLFQAAGINLVQFIEPTHPDSDNPLSLLLVGQPVQNP